jgi:hypothetical protein
MIKWYDDWTPTEGILNAGLEGYYTPGDGSNIYESDTRLIVDYDPNTDPNTWIEYWLPSPTQTPTETNDKSIYDPGDADSGFLGEGDLSVTAGVPEAYQVQTMDIALIGIDGTKHVYARSRMAARPLAGGSSELDEYTFEIIPEPVTLTVLGLGALALFRRRRT